MHKDLIEKAIAEKLEEEIQTLYDTYISSLKDDVNLSNCAKKLLNRSKEYESPSFLILIVGPVKSGKSTLVNLISNCYVSPTDFLECTVRPSLISATEGKEELSVYRYTDTQNNIDENNTNEIINKRDEKIELIFDHVKGLIGEGEIPNINKESYPLDAENIKKYVSSELVISSSKPILLTSIKTKGGILLKNNVYIIDMAGFDGAKSNLGNAGYRKIAERADLIVFVQSSNSAISKVSKEFFELIKVNNGHVPVCLIQNVFKSAYWRENEKIVNDINFQKDYAVKEIRNSGLSISDEHAFNLNLGQVTDLKSNNYLPDFENELSAEAKRFDDVQKIMYDLILENRESIRINNCINRTLTVKNEFVKLLNEIINKRKELLDKYDNINKEITLLRNREINISIDLVSELNRSYERIIESFNILYERYKRNYLPEESEIKIKFNTESARNIIQEFLNGAVSLCKTTFTDIVRSLNLIANNKILLEWITDLNIFFGKFGIKQIDFLNHNIIDIDAPEIPLPPYNYKSIIRHKIFFKHNREEMSSYLKHAQNLLFQHTANGFSSDYLSTNVFPIYKEKLMTISDDYESNIKNMIYDKIENNRNHILQNIIKDIDSYKKITENLSNLCIQLERISVVKQ